ncbi:hypothetical protein AXF42_Ash010453 [Apostasia shenzhenica]|uniref:Uncharacterized protein n=1 Tax=Apostasia shenzhenica TaxID=1088818 RepID=A0A2I0BE35_9ASPA|nr:hypothetical protein AXF42_Ash010453 [Apostasia shenzhenica]
MTMFLSCTCRSRCCLTAQFPVQNTFFRHANQGLACSNPHRSLEAVLRLKSLALLSLLLVSPKADSGMGSAFVYSFPFRKNRMKLHHPLPIKTLEHASRGGQTFFLES